MMLPGKWMVDAIMMKLVSLPVILLAVFPIKINGQVNESDTAKFQLKASFTGNYQKGNVQVTTIKSRIDFSYAPVKSIVLKSQNSSLYQAFYEAKADNDIFSRNYLYFKPQHKWYPFAIGYISTNYRRKIDIRYFAGGGITYQLINKSLHVIKFSVSTVYEQTNFKVNIYNYTEYNSSDKINLWRGTLFASGWDYLLDKRLRFFYDAYWQPAFNNRNNFRTQLDTGIDFFVWKGLSFTMAYSFAHENVVIKNVQPEDKILTFGLAYNLKIKH
ncbi:MAG: DUF481 domain-containing protein [Bacteroidota bacterium]